MTKYKEILQASDLGLNYFDAVHGVQSAIALDISAGRASRTEPKHMRVGIDMSKSDLMGLTCLLMDKGVFTQEEYEEYIRLAANKELNDEQKSHGGIEFR